MKGGLCPPCTATVKCKSIEIYIGRKKEDKALSSFIQEIHVIVMQIYYYTSLECQAAEASQQMQINLEYKQVAFVHTNKFKNSNTISKSSQAL